MSAFENLALFDLDGTLINDAYEPTDSTLSNAVRDAQATGWAVGLNSDTPYEALCLWRKRLGMSGPIVAERGAVVELDSGLYLNEHDAAIVASAQEQVVRFAASRNISIQTGNPVETLRTNEYSGTPGTAVMLLNTLSRCSLRFFVRRVGPGGELISDSELAQTVIEDCRPYLPKFETPYEDNNESAGLLIVSNLETTKRIGTQRLLGAVGLKTCVMVGNSLSDCLGSDIAYHYAVGNATQEYKRVAEEVIPEVVSSGCVAVLRQLTAHASGGKNNSDDIK